MFNPILYRFPVSRRTRNRQRLKHILIVVGFALYSVWAIYVMVRG